MHAHTFESAREARDRMTGHLNESKRLRQALDETAAVIQVAGHWDDPAQRARALRFAKLIE